MSSGHILLSGDGLGLGVLGYTYGFGVRGKKVKSRKVTKIPEIDLELELDFLDFLNFYQNYLNFFIRVRPFLVFASEVNTW